MNQAASEGGRKEPGSKQRGGSADLILNWTAISAITLIAATWRLWFPILDRQASFPLVPLSELLVDAPRVFDWLVGLILLIGWMLVLFGRQRIACAIVIVSAAASMLLDQHRMQPWMYQFMVFAAVFLTVKAEFRLPCLRIFVFSIYFFSALSKLDFEFVHTVGQQFVVVAFDLFGIGNWLNEDQRVALAFGMPMTELLIALGLLPQSTRRPAGIAACCMHLGLLALLGPWSQNHSSGVLFWNLHFAVLAILLFVVEPAKLPKWLNFSKPTRQNTAARKSANQQVSASRNAGNAGLQLKGVLSVWWIVPVLCLPVVERWGYWDHWLSWSLYAPHSSRVNIEVATTAVERLPESLRLITPQIEETELWSRVPISQWSLSEQGVPVYPQARFQAGVARYLASELDSEFEIRATLLGVASRWDGRRQKKTYQGTSKIEQMANIFWLNTQPR